MEIRNLTTFLHVAELNSFTKAAELLGYTQSTVSFQIKQLETELDCLLFERINHTITLTERGNELLAYAQAVCRLTEEFKQDISETSSPKGYIHIVTPDSVCEDMLSHNYRNFRKAYPDISLKFTTADTGDMFKMLDRNEADIVITLDNRIFRKDYVIAKEQKIGMHFVTNSSSQFAGKKNLSIRDIKDEPFILTEKEMGYRRTFNRELAKMDIDIVPALEVGRTDLITLLLEEGEGISYLPDFVTDEYVKKGSLVRLDVTDINIEIWKQLIYHKNKWISNPMKTFIEYVKKAEFK